MRNTDVRATLRGFLKAVHQGVKSREGAQHSVESLCFAILALRHDRGTELQLALSTLEKLQNDDGSWPAFIGDEPRGCWTTAIAALSLVATEQHGEGLQRAIRWLLDAKGREAHWFWRRKLSASRKVVKFDPEKYGWTWEPGTMSWVIPTAFSLVALRQTKHRGLNRSSALSERIDIGISMLIDRMCPGGGWNAGNGIVYGVPGVPSVEATAIALLALQPHESELEVQPSLAWLRDRLPGCPSPYSLAWGSLALGAYRRGDREVREALNRAAKVIEEVTVSGNISTLAAFALAVEAADGDNVFEVKA